MSNGAEMSAKGIGPSTCESLTSRELRSLLAAVTSLPVGSSAKYRNGVFMNPHFLMIAILGGS